MIIAKGIRPLPKRDLITPFPSLLIIGQLGSLRFIGRFRIIEFLLTHDFLISKAVTCYPVRTPMGLPFFSCWVVTISR
jgi:hypothetical protein